MPKEIKVTVRVLGDNSEYVDKVLDGRPLTPHFAAIRPNDANATVGVEPNPYVDKLWSVTHLPTGAKITVVTSLKAAKNVARAAERCMPNVESSDPAEVIQHVDPFFLEYRRTDCSMTFDEFKGLE